MATYLLVFLGVVAIASTVVGLLGVSVVATAEWIQRQVQWRHNDGRPSYQPRTFIRPQDDYDDYQSAAAQAYHPRLRG
jgi:hypothetical protein